MQETNKNFNLTDRQVKYGFGFVRLAITIALILYSDPKLNILELGNLLRWFTFIILPISGNAFNVEILNPKIEKAFLFILFLLSIYDLSNDYTIILYYTKTFIPDLIAGKLDRPLWKFILFLTVVIYIFVHIFYHDEIVQNLNLWLLLAFTQLFCELGDNYFENYVFFRHRFSFEICALFVNYIKPLSGMKIHEKRFVIFDLIASLSYRGGGLLFACLKLDNRKKNQDKENK